MSFLSWAGNSSPWILVPSTLLAYKSEMDKIPIAQIQIMFGSSIFHGLAQVEK
jgi:hypothetical protein